MQSYIFFGLWQNLPFQIKTLKFGLTFCFTVMKENPKEYLFNKRLANLQLFVF
jgi:hypothetical protein